MNCEWDDCFNCALSLSRKKTVCNRGGFRRKVLFVGEAPGEDEERIGKTFVGKSGKLLDEWIAYLGLSEADVLITNVVKCRPPNNRDPISGEIEACRHFLVQEIKELQPKLIIPLGRFARDVISHVRDEGIFPEENYGLALKHPAYYLRQGILYDTDELQYLKKLIERRGI